MHNFKPLCFTLLLLTLLAAAGCGNKGALYLPDNPPVEAASEDDSSTEDEESEH